LNTFLLSNTIVGYKLIKILNNLFPVVFVHCCSIQTRRPLYDTIMARLHEYIHDDLQQDNAASPKATTGQKKLPPATTGDTVGDTTGDTAGDTAGDTVGDTADDPPPPAPTTHVPQLLQTVSVDPHHVSASSSITSNTSITSITSTTSTTSALDTPSSSSLSSSSSSFTMPNAVDEEEVREGQVHWHLARMYMTGELVGKPKEEDKTTDPSSFYNAGALNVLLLFWC
jgi:hypothetical protein